MKLYGLRSMHCLFSGMTLCFQVTGSANHCSAVVCTLLLMSCIKGLLLKGAHALVLYFPVCQCILVSGCCC